MASGMENESLAIKLAYQLTSNQILFCHWKSNIHLAAGIAGKTDLDVLIDEESIDIFGTVAKSLGFLKVKSRSWGEFPQVEDWVGHDSTTGAMIHVHLHSILVTGVQYVKHLYLPWSDYVLAHLVVDQHSGWPKPIPELEFVILLVRAWAKKSPKSRLCASARPHKGVVDELFFLQRQCSWRAVKKVLDDLDLSISAPHQAILAQERLLTDDELSIISKSLYKQLVVHYRLPWLTTVRLSWAKRSAHYAHLIFDRYVAPVQCRKALGVSGAVIALIGSDGSGKSTISADLVKWLRFKLDAHYVYMGSGSGQAGFLNYIRNRAVSYAKKWRKKEGAISGAQKALVRTEPRSLAKLAKLFDLWLLFRKFFVLSHAHRLKNRGSIFIADRYPQSSVQRMNDGPLQQDGEGFAWAADLEKRLFQKIEGINPTLVIKLNVSPEVALARKPDHSYTNLRMKSASIEHIQFRNSDIISIDANLPYEVVLAQIKAKIWMHLIARSDANLI